MITFDDLRKASKTSALVFCASGAALMLAHEAWPNFFTFLIGLLCTLESIVITEWKLNDLARAEASFNEIERMEIEANYVLARLRAQGEAKAENASEVTPNAGFV